MQGSQMEKNDSALVTSEVARNDLSHSTNLFWVLSGNASWSLSLLVSACLPLFFSFCLKKHLNCMHFERGSKKYVYTYKSICSSVILLQEGNWTSSVFKELVFFLWRIFLEWKWGITSSCTPPPPLLPQSAHDEQSQLFWELTHAVVHRSVVL